MPESVAEDIIQLFPHNVSDLVFDVTPITSVPSQTETFTPTSTIPSKPTLLSQPGATTSAPSSPTKEVEEENLIPRRRRSSRDDIMVIRRIPQQGEASQARAKIALRTSGAE